MGDGDLIVPDLNWIRSSNDWWKQESRSDR